MNNSGFEHPVYKKYFRGLKNVRNVPQETQDTKPERVNVQYPLARDIAKGKLTQYEGFDSYIHGNVFVLCNLRIKVSQDGMKEMRTWSKKNPDIIALTSQGEITAFECKNEAKFPSDDIKRMAKTFITLIDIAGPYAISNKTAMIRDSWSELSFLYEKCYEKESRFPSLQDSLSELFSLSDFEAKQRWAQLTMEYIQSSKFRYIIAFAGVPKRKNIQQMIRDFEIRIKEYGPSLTEIDLTEKIGFLSLKNGEIQDLKPAKYYLD